MLCYDKLYNLEKRCVQKNLNYLKLFIRQMLYMEILLGLCTIICITLSSLFISHTLRMAMLVGRSTPENISTYIASSVAQSSVW